MIKFTKEQLSKFQMVIDILIESINDEENKYQLNEIDLFITANDSLRKLIIHHISDKHIKNVNHDKNCVQK